MFSARSTITVLQGTKQCLKLTPRVHKCENEEIILQTVNVQIHSLSCRGRPFVYASKTANFASRGAN